MDNFIHTSRGDGEVDSEGAFTIAADTQALKKLAQHSLPFAGAWAVKLVQFAVASAAHRIEVFQRKKNTRFCFHLPKPLDLDEIQRAFASTKLSENRGVNHLVAALRDVGIRMERGFTLQLRRERRRLCWDGAVFTQEETAKIATEVEIEVAHLSKSEHAEYLWLVRNSVSAERNVDVAKALTERCFTCPCPLIIDGINRSSLLDHPLDEAHYTMVRVPVLLGFPESDGPSFVLPEATFPEDYEPAPGPWRLSRPLVANAAVLFSACLKAVGMQTLEATNDSATSSFLYSLHDGVVVERESLGLTRMTVSLHLFLSVQDQQLDLTGFGVQATDELNVRKQKLRRQAIKIAAKECTRVFRQTLDSRPRDATSLADHVSLCLPGLGGIASLGAVATCLVPVFALKGLFVVATGSVIALNAQKKPNFKIPVLSDDFERTVEAFKATLD